MLETLHGSSSPCRQGLCRVCALRQRSTQPLCHGSRRPACCAPLSRPPPASLHGCVTVADRASQLLGCCQVLEGFIAQTCGLRIALHAARECAHCRCCREQVLHTPPCWGTSRRALHLDDEGAAAHALEAAPGLAHAEGGLQLGGSCHAPGMPPSVATLDEDCHPPARFTGDLAHMCRTQPSCNRLVKALQASQAHSCASDRGCCAHAWTLKIEQKSCVSVTEVMQ